MTAKFFLIAAITSMSLAGSAGAVSLSKVIRDCGDDGKAFCKGVGYGAPMQACLSQNKAKLTPQCKATIDRLDKGEKVGIFG